MRAGLDELKEAEGTIEDGWDTVRTERDVERTRDQKGEELEKGCRLSDNLFPMAAQIRGRMDAMTRQIHEM